MLLNLLFWGFALVAVLAALGVVFMQRTVYNVLSLVLVFVATAGCFVLSFAPFLGMVLVVLYVGAVAVFFLFAVMMFGSDLEESPLPQLPLRGVVLLTSLGLGCFLLSFVFMLLGVPEIVAATDVPQGLNAKEVGKTLMMHYGVSLQIVGLALLSAIVGGISLTNYHRRYLKRQKAFEQIATTSKDRLRLVQVPTSRGVSDV